MEGAPKHESARDPLMEQLSLNRRINNYKECCYRAYAYGLAALLLVSPISYFTLRKFPLRTNHIIMTSGCFGSVAAYMVSQEKSKECNLILKAHRESMRNPVKPDSPEETELVL